MTDSAELISELKQSIGNTRECLHYFDGASALFEQLAPLERARLRTVFLYSMGSLSFGMFALACSEA